MANEEYSIVKEGQEDVMKINAEAWSFSPSLEDNAMCMALTIDRLVGSPGVSRIIYSQRKKYGYDYEQTQMLVEIANVYGLLIRQKKMLSLSDMPFNSESIAYAQGWRAKLQYVVLNLLRSDPISAYVELKRMLREERLNRAKASENSAESFDAYIARITEIINLLENTKMIGLVKNDIAGHNIGEREIYKRIFRPMITPDFVFTRLMIQQPIDAEELDLYSVGNADVSIFRTDKDIKYLYHLTPPEFKISEDKYTLLDMARTVLAEHKPKEEEFLEPEKMRNTFRNIGRDLLQELAMNQGIELEENELNDLASILVRYTVGFGLIEVLLQDPKVQDIMINAPVGDTPIFLVHEEFEECATNIMPSKEDVESWATKFRIVSGRPLDEANPILDTELSIPGARARVAIIQKPLNPYGLAFSLRRHRDKPWTLPLFIKTKMISPLGAGLLSFLIDGSRSILIAGTKGSGKTSMISAGLIELMRKFRVILVEDTLEIPALELKNLRYNIQSMKVRSALTKGGTEVSADEGIRTSLRMGDSALIVGEVRSSIRGDEEVLIVENGITKRIPIKEIEGKNISNIYVPSLDFDLKFKLKRLTAFIKHPKRNKLLEVTTKTGRKITVTPDHSLFTHNNFKIVPIECQNIKKGDKIIIPEKLPCGYNDVDHINLLDILDCEECRAVNYEEDLRCIIKKIGWKNATKICAGSNDVYQYLRKGVQHTNIPIRFYKELSREAGYGLNMQLLQVKNGTSKTLSANIAVNKDFCRFLGYYIAEGCIQKNQGNVVFSNADKRIIDDIMDLSRRLFGIEPKLRVTKSLGESTQVILSNNMLALLLKRIGCGRTSVEKRVPSLFFGLAEDKICEFLRGYFDGDCSQTSARSSGNRIACSTVSKGLANDLAYLFLSLGLVARIYTRQPRGIGKHTQYILEFKQRKYVETFLEKIGFGKYKKELIHRNVAHSTLNTINYDINVLENCIKLKRKYRHLRKYKSCGKEYLKKIVEESEDANFLLKNFINGEFFLDEIKEIKKVYLQEGEHVYDLSVEPCQNFVGGFGGIMLHNTEAFALYEAMRIGSLANVVMGSIHGDSPYGVYDRVVNDLQVPKTSFKATDIIVITNPMKSPDGLHKWRRVVQITEVRKHWENDPLLEKGFVDLMKYNAKTDTLEPTDDLINGDSEVIKAIAGNIKEWAGNWDAVWSNILLRAKIKEAIVNYSTKENMPELIEADFVVRSNDHFHRLCYNVKEDAGYLDSERIFFEWEDWLKREIKTLKMVGKK